MQFNEITSQNTHLMYKAGDAFKELVRIKDYPDSGAEPEQIEVTDLSDTASRRYINGLQDASAMTFTVSYTSENYAALKEVAGDKGTFAVYFGKTAEFGGFQWEGELSFWHVGKGVNETKELMVSVTVASGIDNIDPEAAA